MKKVKKFVLVRTYSAGVFAGYLESHQGQEVRLTDAIRIWYWSGAASLSQLANEGVKNPNQCKFGVPIDLTVTQAIEIIDMTEAARKNIQAVKPWRE